MMLGLFEVAPASEGLVYHTPWWRPIVGRISSLPAISIEKAAAVALTVVNALLIGALVFRFVRSRRRAAAVRASNPASDVAELARGGSSYIEN
jgi:hypothetical protein